MRGRSMKKVIALMVVLYVAPSQAFFSVWWGKKSIEGAEQYKTYAAQQVYTDCMNGASGDPAVTGCKSKQCRRTCKAIGDIVDQAKAEGIYPYFEECAFGTNRRNDRGYWIQKHCRKSCHIRRKRDWKRCYHEAKIKAKKNVPVKSRSISKHQEDHQIDTFQQFAPSSNSICAQPWFLWRKSK